MGVCVAGLKNAVRVSMRRSRPSYFQRDSARRMFPFVPGTSFNVDYSDHFRVTLLPDEETIQTVFQRMEALLEEM